MHRYEPTEDVFTSSNTTNSCYCQKVSEGSTQKIATCPPAGTCDISACKFGVPILVSFPHFYGGDKALLNHVDGLNPREEIHKTYAEIHPVSLINGITASVTTDFGQSCYYCDNRDKYIANISFGKSLVY